MIIHEPKYGILKPADRTPVISLFGFVDDVHYSNNIIVRQRLAAFEKEFVLIRFKESVFGEQKLTSEWMNKHIAISNALVFYFDEKSFQMDLLFHLGYWLERHKYIIIGASSRDLIKGDLYKIIETYRPDIANNIQCGLVRLEDRILRYVNDRYDFLEKLDKKE